MEAKHFESLYPDTVRESEIQQIVKNIQHGNSTQVIGVPGVGRSTLLGFLAYNHSIHLKHFPTTHSFIHFVMVNFSEVKEKSFSEIVKFLLLSVSTSLRERNKTEEFEYVDKLLKEALSYNDELILIEKLKHAVEYLSVEKKMTIIFLFDKFDEYVLRVPSHFFTLLRSLREKAKYRFSVVFSLTRSLEEVVDKEIYQDYSDFVLSHRVYLQLLNIPSVQFRISYIEKLAKKSLTNAQRDAIITLTGGHMRLVKVCTESVLSSNSDEVPSGELLLSTLSVQSALFDIWNSLTPVEQELLLNPTIGGVERSYLEDVNLLDSGRITLPLLSSLVDAERSTLSNSTLRWDETTQSIKRGKSTLSDSLTRSEFRLLKYLLQNPERVVERDEIISIVWKDDKSTSGVTDQAVDQLLFRLRRKIESDPINPIHIKTVKSRGVLFTP